MKMDSTASEFLFLLLLSIHIIVSSSRSILLAVEDFGHQEDEQTPKYSSRKELVKTVQHDFINPPFTSVPTAPVTNPVTTPAPGTVPPDTSTPPAVTVPPANPVPVTPTTPITYPPANPVSNPVNPQVPVTNPVTNPGGQPVNNPVASPTPVGGVPATNPVVAPPVISNAPAIPGQSWCVVRSGVPDTAVQAALDYACGMGGVDCSNIQQGAGCYNPNTLQNHASYAFNSYYQRNPVQTSCDFGGTAVITNVNPSSGSCVFTMGSPSTASPTTASPVTTTPTPTPTTETSSGATPTGAGIPPSSINAGNPALGGGTAGYGDGPSISNSSSVSGSSSLQPFIGCIVVATSIITGKIILDI